MATKKEKKKKKRLTINRILHRPELLAEFALLGQPELRGDGVVRAAEHLEPRALEVMPGGQLLRGAAAERGRGGAGVGAGLEGVEDELLDAARGRPGEVEGELDLPAVLGRELGEDDEAADGLVLGDGVVVLSVGFVLPGGQQRPLCNKPVVVSCPACGRFTPFSKVGIIIIIITEGRSTDLGSFPRWVRWA